MTQKVEPALMPNDWVVSGPEDAMSWYEDWDMGIIDVYLEYPRHRMALAARALHDQPFGFTREDVACLRRLVEYMPRFTMMVGDLLVEPLTSLADRIEALLPPEE